MKELRKDRTVFCAPDAARDGKVARAMTYTERKALVKRYLGEVADIEVDRPIGTPHPKHPEIIYPINYGYIPGVLGGDGEELDVYLLGVGEIVERYRVRIIAAVHRTDDVEDKLVGIPEDMLPEKFPTEAQVREAVRFQEQFHEGFLEMWEPDRKP